MSKSDRMLGALYPDRAYLKWCVESPEGQEFQHIWRRPMFETEEKHAMGTCKPLRTNINPGDRVMHGMDNFKAPTPQVSIIIGKILHLRGHLKQPSNFEYRIDWNIGGHYGSKTHEEITDGYWIWIPWFEQLVTLGIDVDRAARLVLGQEEKRR